MTATTNYKKLENKYGNFIVPALKIKSGGSDLISSLNLSVLEMQVTLSLESAGMVIIRIGGAYDVKSHSFDKKVKNGFKLGSIMEIELGYLSATEPVFKGYVAGIGAEFTDGQAIFVVKLHDVRKLMMTSGVKRQMYEVKNYSDVVKKIMGDYSKLCSVECDDTDDKLTAPVSQSTNDYNFICREIISKGKSEREFFVFMGKAYFRKPFKNKSPIMTVNLGRELLWFRMMADHMDAKIQVVGYDPVNCKEIVSETVAKSTEPVSALLSPVPTQYFIDADADSEAKAKIRAEAIASGEVMKTCYARGELVGLPEIVPGRFIQVDSLEKMADKKYYISEVNHIISSDSFVTQFETKGWQ